MTTPNLPPLPEPHAANWIYTIAQMQAYALAAHQAGRDAGLEEAEQLCEREGALYTGLDMAGRIRALKSDAKEPAWLTSSNF